MKFAIVNNRNRVAVVDVSDRFNTRSKNSGSGVGTIRCNAIGEVEWSKAADDVRRFLRPREAASLDLWSARFFAARLAKMIRQMG